MGKICGSARGEYGLSTDLGARRHAVEILVHAELSLRSGYGFTPSTDDAGTSTANVRTTYSLREFFTIFPMVTCSTDGVLSTCVVRAWSVRGPCVVRAYSALPKFNCPMSRQNSRGPYRVSTCSALTTHLFGVRATYLQLAQPCAWRAFTYSLSALATPSLRFQKKTWRAWPPQKTYGKKPQDGLCPRLYATLWNAHVSCAKLH